MVDRFGFVPNGSRSYYLNRSQPPLLSEMVYEYYHTTKDAEFVQKVSCTDWKNLTLNYFFEKNTKAVGTLEKEYAFWMATSDRTGGHAVALKGRNGDCFHLNRYTVKVNSLDG